VSFSEGFQVERRCTTDYYVIFQATYSRIAPVTQNSPKSSGVVIVVGVPLVGHLRRADCATTTLLVELVLPLLNSYAVLAAEQ
jgi:hypothetical protein